MYVYIYVYMKLLDSGRSWIRYLYHASRQTRPPRRWASLRAFEGALVPRTWRRERAEYREGGRKRERERKG